MVAIKADSHPNVAVRAFRFLKWPLFAIELFLLWMLFNAVFVAPGLHPNERIRMAAVLATLSASTAWASGRLFQGVSSDGRSSRGQIFATPPVVICIFVLSVTAVAMTVLLANR
jgi:hypothetical protein